MKSEIFAPRENAPLSKMF